MGLVCRNESLSEVESDGPGAGGDHGLAACGWWPPGEEAMAETENWEACKEDWEAA